MRDTYCHHPLTTRSRVSLSRGRRRVHRIPLLRSASFLVGPCDPLSHPRPFEPRPLAQANRAQHRRQFVSVLAPAPVCSATSPVVGDEVTSRVLPYVDRKGAI
jgi:hypothetical protein